MWNSSNADAIQIDDRIVYHQPGISRPLKLLGDVTAIHKSGRSRIFSFNVKQSKRRVVADEILEVHRNGNVVLPTPTSTKTTARTTLPPPLLTGPLLPPPPTLHSVPQTPTSVKPMHVILLGDEVEFPNGNMLLRGTAVTRIVTCTNRLKKDGTVEQGNQKSFFEIKESKSGLRYTVACSRVSFVSRPAAKPAGKCSNNHSCTTCAPGSCTSAPLPTLVMPHLKLNLKKLAALPKLAPNSHDTLSGAPISGPATRLTADKLKTLNSKQAATSCAQCGEELVQVSLAVKYCRTCEG